MAHFCLTVIFLRLFLIHPFESYWRPLIKRHHYLAYVILPILNWNHDKWIFMLLSKRGQYNIYIWSLWPLESHFRHVQLIFLNCSNSRIFSFLSCIFIKMQFLIFNANASLGSIRSLRKLKAIKIILLKSPNWFQIVLLASMLLF